MPRKKKKSEALGPKKELEQAIRENKVVIGSKEVIRALLRKELTKILVARNCPEDIKGRLRSLAGDVALITLEENNEQLGELCKKSFSVATVGIKK